MRLTADRFPEFFAAIYGDQVRPYRWQQQMLESLLETGHWPETIDVPTGGGKSAVIDVHVFANAIDQQRLDDGDPGPRIPRRLSTVVPRRAIVDQQLDRATAVAEMLCHEATGILAEVRDLLIRRSSPDGCPETARVPLRVHLLRGGTATVAGTGRFRSSRDEWLNYPTAVQVLCATPDMLGSRLLFRGYGASAWSRSRAAGLLGYDHVAVIDEAHLSRQLVDTFRRVSSMTGRWNPVAKTVPSLQVCAATATQDHNQDQNRIGLDWGHLEPHLAAILTRPKPVEYRPIPGWNGTSAAARKNHIGTLLEAAEKLRSESAGLIGVVVNRVATAVAVQEAAAAAGWNTRLVVGPMRVGATGSLNFDGVDLVVATQTIEVGVDIDFAGMVTDLAAGTALVQRAGRVNRNGAHPAATVIIVGPDQDKTIETVQALPYRVSDLHAARDWVVNQAEGGGISPEAIRSSDVPEVGPPRPVFSHLEAADVRLLSRTSEHLVAEPDLSFWLRDSLDPETPDIQVVGRALPSLKSPKESTDQQAATLRAERVDTTYQLLTHLVFDDSEAYPSTPAGLRRILRNKNVLEDHQAWVRHDGTWTLLQDNGSELPHSQPLSSIRFHPGDLVVLDAALPCTLGLDTAGKDKSPGVVLAAEGHRPIGDFSDPDLTGTHIFWNEGVTKNHVPEPTAVCRAVIDEALTDDGTIDVELLPTDQLDTEHAVYDVLVGPGTDETDGEPDWVLCRRRDPEVQPGHVDPSSNIQPVLLETHQGDVADRAAALGQKLGLDAGLVEALAQAGLHHDDGKQAEQFQAMLRANGTEPGTGWPETKIRQVKEAQKHHVYAKSLGLLPQISRTVPTVVSGWRHEMYSAALYWSETGQATSSLPQKAGTCELVTWLIGTHHGRGRAGFPLTAPSEVAPGADGDVASATRTLFAEGLWDDLAILVEHSLGPWGVAYLEALLRAADNTISQEGR
jgi:CRISPR-associated endonuclease/helicase Cas3